MFCKNCGNQLNDTDKFCGKCGTFVSSKNGYGSAHKKKANTKKLSTYGKLIAISAVVILLAVSGVFRSRSGSDRITKDFGGAVKSGITENTWYTMASNNVVCYQNAKISDAVSMSKGKVFMITYYPVCKECHSTGTLQMTGVGTNDPVSETYYCENCGKITYIRFKIEY